MSALPPDVQLDVSLQQSLERLYRIDESPPVTAFRIDRDAFVALLGRAAAAQREALLVHHDGDETLLALFICDEVMARAEQFSVAPPDTSTLDAFCVAAEGVSHYVYFTYCGERLDRPVSQIELELQAEIDKFVLLRVLFGIDGESLVESLFDNAQLADDLDEQAHERYQVAHRLGRRYARWFDRHARSGNTAAALTDARRLYRMPLAEKLAHIARAACIDEGFADAGAADRDLAVGPVADAGDRRIAHAPRALAEQPAGGGRRREPPHGIQRHRAHRPMRQAGIERLRFLHFHADGQAVMGGWIADHR